MRVLENPGTNHSKLSLIFTLTQYLYQLCALQYDTADLTFKRPASTYATQHKNTPKIHFVYFKVTHPIVFI